ncbi:MAG: DUF2306 domain-containing protein [Flavobacteriales bacterium]|nr:DUF2306 domain-containing protein [Flavobacteriales bacterium]MCB9447813.1 DUF2306 domain-containing protein [Flavobacteriales bacterium]
MAAILSLLIGIYPVLYFLSDEPFGILLNKPEEVVKNALWMAMFYGHIGGGGLALAIGWLQFSKKLRTRRIALHRTIGKIYMIAALIGGLCGIFLAFYAEGNVLAAPGFTGLGMVWVSTSIMGYLSIRKGKTDQHQSWMTYSFAMCFAAVTFRIWLGVLASSMADFNMAYGLAAWLCWLPNLGVAYLVRR